MSAPQLTAQIQGQGTVSADQLNTYVQNCTNIALLRTFIGLPGMLVFVDGFDVPGDGGAGPFYWNTTSTGPDNGTSIIVPQTGVPGAWIRLVISQTSIVTVANIAALEAFDGGSAVPVIYVQGYQTIGDGGEGIFVYDAADATTPPNGGTIIVDGANNRYVRELNGQPLTILMFGGYNNGVGDNVAAWNLLVAALPGASGVEISWPAGTYLFSTSISYNFPSAVPVYSMNMVGYGATLFWPNANGGMVFNYSSPQHTLSARGLSFTTAQVNSGNAIQLTQSSPLGSFLISAFRDCVFRGSVIETDYWSVGVIVNTVSGTTFDSCSFYGGGSTITSGNGIIFEGSGTTSSFYTTNNKISKCTFNLLGYGVTCGTYSQGITVKESNFDGVYVGIYQPSGSAEADQLNIADCQISPGTSGLHCIFLNGNSLNVTIRGCYLLPLSTNAGIYLGTVTYATVIGNNLIGPTGFTAYGIECNGAHAVITGNTLTGFINGVLLDSSSTFCNVQSNNYNNNTVNVQNNGTNNTVGGGSP
jgi:hypothetical protein